MSATPRRRFWSAVTVRPEDGGFAVALDGRPLRTPARRPVVVPTAALAEAIAGEWRTVESEIRPDHLPHTRAVNTALDRLPVQRAAVVAAIAAYGASDLLCYRAEAPAELAARQAAAWDPWLAWARRDLGAPLVAVIGVMPVPQPAGSLAALTRAVEAQDNFRLAGLTELVSLSGSLVLGLAVARGVLDVDLAWTLSRVDETWQAEQWGADAEAEAAAAKKAAEFRSAAEFLALLDPNPVEMGKP